MRVCEVGPTWEFGILQSTYTFNSYIHMLGPYASLGGIQTPHRAIFGGTPIYGPGQRRLPLGPDTKGVDHTIILVCLCEGGS